MVANLPVSNDNSSTVSAASVPTVRNVNFKLDDNRKEFLTQFKDDFRNDIITAIRTEFRQDIAVVNSRVDVIEEKLDSHADLYKSLIQRVTAL